MRSGTRFKLGLTYTRATESVWTVEAVKQVTYRVIATRDLFAPGNQQLLQLGEETWTQPGDRRLVVLDSNVERIHGARVRAWFERQGIRASVMAMRADESVKEWGSVERVVDAMNAFGIDRRREPVIVIGGGVLMDVVGLAASLYRRGTPYIRVPTTLIGLVDAGIGVKTGINYDKGKNRLGTYAPATVTFVDRYFLSTLGDRHLSNGMAEVLKMALVRSAELFELLERHGGALVADRFQGSTQKMDEAARNVIAESIQLMLEELQPNLWEGCLERCVDYGHTFSPTLEMAALPELLHGEAVAIDMALTSVIGFLRGDVSAADLGRILRVMRQLGLPLWTEVLAHPGLLDTALRDTVRHRDGQQRLPLPLGIGAHRFVNDVSAEEITAAAAHLRLATNRIGSPLATAVSP